MRRKAGHRLFRAAMRSMRWPDREKPTVGPLLRLAAGWRLCCVKYYQQLKYRVLEPNRKFLFRAK